MLSTQELANGTVNILNNNNLIEETYGDFFRRLIREELERYYNEKVLTTPSKYRPPLFLEIGEMRIEFDPKVFTTGKLIVHIPKNAKARGQCPDGYKLVQKNGCVYCKLIDKQ